MSELGRRNVLHEEPARTSEHRLIDVLVEVEGGQDQNVHGGWGALHQPTGCFEPVHLGHADVHQHDVGEKLQRPLDGLRTVCRLGDDLHVRL